MPSTFVSSLTVNASAAATAWLNAFLATGQDPDRPILNRTLSVEFFPTGVQFIACDGALLFRSWVPKQDADADWPDDEEHPDTSVVVTDAGHFALGFVRTLLAATKHMEVAELALSIDPAPEEDGEVPLGADFSKEVLTLRAFGQQLHCRLYEVPYVGWRKLNFGLEQAERVDGMKVHTRMFQAVGKLRGIGGVDCTFTGGERQIILTGEFGSFRGLMMPMQRPKKDAPEPADEPEEQEEMEGITSATIQVGDGPKIPFTTTADRERAQEHIADGIRSQLGGRDRAAGRDE